MLSKIIKLFGFVPLNIRSQIGSWLGSLIYLLPGKDKKFAALQLKVIMPEVETGKCLQGVYAGLGQNLFEVINLKPLTDKPHKIRLDANSSQLLSSLKAEGVPILALTAHLSNWDLLGAFLVKEGFKVSTIGREARNRHLQKILSSLREGYGIKTIWRSDSSTAKAIINEFKNCNMIGALIDQDTYVQSVMIDFMGRPARTPCSLVSIAKKFNARVVTAFITRRGLGAYDIEIKQIDSGLADKEILKEYNDRLSEKVRAFPAQWVWIHKRWRSISKDERMSSKDYMAYLQNEVAAKK
jgi:KDO2-lipid IV(A) lauroyltransferase